MNTTGTTGTSDHSATMPVRLTPAQRQAIIVELRSHHVRRAGLFGSMVRGDAWPESDIDILIQPAPTMSLFEFSALALALEQILGRPVDLVTYASLHPRLHASVYAHYEPLFTDEQSESAADTAAEASTNPRWSNQQYGLACPIHRFSTGNTTKEGACVVE